MTFLTRRSFVVGSAGALGAVALPTPAIAGGEALAPIPLARFVASAGGPVVDAAFLAEQLSTANDLFSGAGVSFDAISPDALDEKYAALETRSDRDSLGDSIVEHQVSIFFVRSLRDVDDPKNFRMGVTWRRLSKLTTKYIIVAASARPTTMAHELGHYFGLDHTFVKNNLMSYDRDGGPVTLSDVQLQTIRRNAAGALARKDLLPRA